MENRSISTCQKLTLLSSIFKFRQGKVTTQHTNFLRRRKSKSKDQEQLKTTDNKTYFDTPSAVLKILRKTNVYPSVIVIVSNCKFYFVRIWLFVIRPIDPNPMTIYKKITSNEGLQKILNTNYRVYGCVLSLPYE